MAGEESHKAPSGTPNAADKSPVETRKYSIHIFNYFFLNSEATRLNELSQLSEGSDARRGFGKADTVPL